MLQSVADGLVQTYLKPSTQECLSFFGSCSEYLPGGCPFQQAGSQNRGPCILSLEPFKQTENVAWGLAREVSGETYSFQPQRYCDDHRGGIGGPYVCRPPGCAY